MSTSKAKRSRAFSSSQSEACSSSQMLHDELIDSLSLGKELTEGRHYLFDRKSKKTATYWSSFIEYEENGLLRVECKYCDKTYACDSNVNGTKNVKWHFQNCPANPDNRDGEMQGARGVRQREHVNLSDLREAFTQMIMVDEQPFRLVERLGFRHFLSLACPGFHIPSRTTIARNCYDLYLSEKGSLKKMLQSCQRICVTTDTWTSIQRINYMCLTIHYIDNDWKLHKKIINFCPISSHKGEAIGKGVQACLEEWEIEDKLFTVTVDNASSNDVACNHLKKMLQLHKNKCISEGKYLHMRCMAHIINLIVWDGIKEHMLCIDRVRNAVKFVKNSPQRKARFEELAQKAKIVSKSSLSLDVPTRWNSTYTMLETALKFQCIFSGFGLPEGENVPTNEKPPDASDWRKVEMLVVFLRGFYILTRKVSGSLYLTSNKGLFEIATMNEMLNKWKRSNDIEFNDMAISMREKYDKYWGSMDKMNMLLYLAVILDPHSKLKAVTLILADLFGKERGKLMASEVKTFAFSLFEEYRRMSSSSYNSQSDDLMSSEPTEDDNIDEFEESDYYMKNVQERIRKMDETSGYARSEFNRYLGEQLVEEEGRMDVLKWWGINGHRYPIVSRMARDILAIPLSTVASESAFSAGGRHLDPFRSSLTPKMVQALICGQDWIRAKLAIGGAPGAMEIDMEENLREIEQLEKDLPQNEVQDEVIYIDSSIQ